MVERLTKRCAQFADFPMSGRTVPEYYTKDIRELIEKPYRIIYRIKPDQIDVLAVVHGARLQSLDIEQGDKRKSDIAAKRRKIRKMV